MSTLRQQAAAEPAVDRSTPTATAAPAIDTTPHQPPSYNGAATKDSSLQKTSSGGWGERQSGPGVNVSEALHLARSSSRRGDQQTTNQSTNKPAMVEEESSNDLEKQQSHFNLNDFLVNRLQQADAQGVKNNKALGLAWRDLQVKVAASGSGGYTFVKTLPTAITNTLWKDPWSILITVIPPLSKLGGNSKGTSRNILHPQSGVLRSGEMLLVLARPGSGSSTTLRALTSSLPSNVTTDGSLHYGGLDPGAVSRKYRGEVIFVDEDDLHFATLSVAQTLRVALKTKAPRSTSRLQGESRDDYIENSIDVLLKMFGMTHVRDTIVGDAAVRGVSGGERKRVTISEALATRASVVAWDNSTRGLDASTALDYARSLRILTDLTQRTTIATLYQVAESIFNLFDRVAVVDEGRLIYYGPRDQARSYFESLGYYAPERMTTADFVTLLSDPNQAKFQEGKRESAPKTAAEREAAWKNSDLNRKLLAEIDSYEKSLKDEEKREAEQMKLAVRSEKNKGVHKGSSFTVPFHYQVGAVMYRQVLLKWHSRGDLYVKLFTIISVSLMVASVFYNQPFTSQGAFTRGSVMLFAGLFNGWLQLAEAFEAVSGRPMLARHRAFAFYRPSAVVIARAVVDIPLLIIQCVLSSVIIYFLANLRVNAGAFFIFLVYTFLSAYNLTALYRFFAAFSPDFNTAIRFGVLGLNIIIVFLGYVIPRQKMNWTIFMNYINGISYSFEGFMGNEFKYDIDCATAQIVPFGESRDTAYQTCALQGARPGSLTVPGEDYLQAAFGYTQANVGPNIGVLIAFSVLYLLLTLIASEIMNFGESTGGLLVFARTKNTKKAVQDQEKSSVRSDDVEAAAVPNEKPSPALESDSTRANSETDSQTKKVNELEKPKSHDDRAVFTWKDVSLELPGGRKLLQNVDGFVKPGTMTALMGASGAGKTTLLSTLSQRSVAGKVTGDILVDGKGLGIGFQKGTGLVLQADVHLATQTVKEAVELAALLRQPAHVPREEKLAHAQHIIELLELDNLKDALVGTPGFGLGVEKAKRLSIAVELAAKPDLLLFLDEPTSGLDSAGAASIVRLLRRLAEDGQAILCTIHQPSSLLFESFDNVLLLEAGGQTAIMSQIGRERGKGSDLVREYFERNGAPKCEPHENVAEYMLEIVSGDRGRGLDFAQKWRTSPEREALRKQIDDLVEERKGRPDNTAAGANSEFSATPWTQIVEVTKRQLRDTWRDAPFAYGILFSNFVTGIVAGGAFAHLGTSSSDLQLRLFICFLIILNLPALVNSIIGKVFEMRILFEVRESPSKTYAWYALVTAIMASIIPVAVLASVLWFVFAFFIPFYSRESSVAGYFYLMTLLFQIFGCQFAFMLAASCITPIIASNLLPFILPILALINGIVIPQSQMTEPWKSFVYWVNPLTHYLRGQLGSTLHGIQVNCTQEDFYRFDPPPGQNCGAYAGDWAMASGGYLESDSATSDCGYCQYRSGDIYLQGLNASFDFRWQSFGIFLGYIIFNVGAIYALWFYFRHKGYGIIPSLPKFGKKK